MMVTHTPCHAERSEASVSPGTEMLSAAKHDTVGPCC